jgi:hypothetical protein
MRGISLPTEGKAIVGDFAASHLELIGECFECPIGRFPNLAYHPQRVAELAPPAQFVCLKNAGRGCTAPGQIDGHSLSD